MKQITTITNDTVQKLRLVGENNEQIDFKLRYLPSQQAWYFDLSYQGIDIDNMKLVTSPNLLRQWENYLPFGLACLTLDGADPFFIDDFIDERVQIYLLGEEDLETVEDLYY